jgi:hypothetical protein
MRLADEQEHEQFLMFLNRSTPLVNIGRDVERHQTNHVWCLSVSKSWKR